MKKNLRIVSAAAAALLAVAPVAATAMPVNAATTVTTSTTTNKPTVDLSGAGSVSESKDIVNVTPSFTLTSAAKGIPATLQGSIEASLNGTSVTADVADVAKDVTLTDDGGKTVYSYNDRENKVDNNLSAVEAGKKYTMTLSGVGFSFGKANAGKTLTFKLPKNVKVNDTSNDVKVSLDQYGNATNLKFVISNIKAYDSANTNAVSFYDAKSGLVATQGSYMTLADENGNLNVTTLLDKLKGKYEAMQFKDSKFKTVNVNTTADDVKAELEKAGIKVDAAGNFEAPDTFTVTLNAKSDVNGKTAPLPVVVTVPNGKSTVVPSQSKTIMHNAYFYDKNAKRVGTDKVTRYNAVTVAMNTTKLANGISYYEVIENGKATGKYINADNIDGTKRTLKHNAYVYKSSKKRANKVVLKKGTEVTTYGNPYTFKNGKKYYKIGADTKKTYVRVENFD
ncbi:SLAP domain-containing protein [Lactobacillus helveticus]|uniref:S-layer protein n=1 Tax=Lactobacillus helveticus CIRM-BIA 951 TaxID=1226334 RepID=U6F568_LACHE|nr:SLAP domain-containing protein [Lactobacillus helveticus]MDY0990578.1 SLAP domain-containing protein [Lactobacillus helveticus]MDY1001258.1 SLAP domain-containing protein [Lactobacillus helveticus]MEB2873099.1 SLAP domain-containing protein [Lactobacillus helveticus]CDI57775.1 Surface layer protein [Lactobacillus helveticus CIRM-BIA 951]